MRGLDACNDAVKLLTSRLLLHSLKLPILLVSHLPISYLQKNLDIDAMFKAVIAHPL